MPLLDNSLNVSGKKKKDNWLNMSLIVALIHVSALAG
jgi:hypothetical protein